GGRTYAGVWANLLFERPGAERWGARKGAVLQFKGAAPRGIASSCASLLTRSGNAACRHPPCPCIACFGTRFRRSRAGFARGLYGVVAYLVRSQHRERHRLRDLRSLLGTSPHEPDPVPMPVVLLMHLPLPISGSAVAPTPYPGVPAATNVA